MDPGRILAFPAGNQFRANPRHLARCLAATDRDGHGQETHLRIGHGAGRTDLWRGWQAAVGRRRAAKRHRGYGAGSRDEISPGRGGSVGHEGSSRRCAAILISDICSQALNQRKGRDVAARVGLDGDRLGLTVTLLITWVDGFGMMVMVSLASPEPSALWAVPLMFAEHDGAAGATRAMSRKADSSVTTRDTHSSSGWL